MSSRELSCHPSGIHDFATERKRVGVILRITTAHILRWEVNTYLVEKSPTQVYLGGIHLMGRDSGYQNPS